VLGASRLGFGPGARSEAVRLFLDSLFALSQLLGLRRRERVGDRDVRERGGSAAVLDIAQGRSIEALIFSSERDANLLETPKEVEQSLAGGPKMNRISLSFLTLLVSVGIVSPFAAGQSESHQKPETRFPLQSEFLMQLTADLDPAQVVGDTPQGDRRIIPVIGGSFSGPQLKGQVLVGGGGDWLLFRKDGAAQLDVRTTLRTDDGVLIYVSYRGVSVIPADVRQRIMSGQDVDPAQYYFRTTPYFETASEKYSWLNKLVTVGVGKRTKTSVVYSIYAIK
jgi:hypothetical protein